jgi:ABC-2 type transport system permease protein
MKRSFLKETLKYLEVAKVNYLNTSVYTVNLISRSVLVVVRIWAFTQLYQVAFAASRSTEIGGLTVPMVIWILMMTQSFQSSTRPHVSQLIDEEVKSGTLAYMVNRPYSYALFHYFGYLGRTFSSLWVNLAIGSLVSLALVGLIDFNWWGLLFGLGLLIFGVTLNFLIYLIIGLTAFWVEDTSAFTWIYSKGQLVFGGLILPLALFPENLLRIAEILPFSQLFYSAARVVVDFDLSLFWHYALIQIAWLAFFGLIAYQMFQRGIKNVSINGG